MESQIKRSINPRAGKIVGPFYELDGVAVYDIVHNETGEKAAVCELRTAEKSMNILLCEKAVEALITMLTEVLHKEIRGSIQ